MQETEAWSLCGKILWRRKWQPTPVSFPGKSHGQRNMVDYSQWDCRRVGHDLVINQQLCKFSSVQSLSRVRLFSTPWTAALQASLSITNSLSPPKYTIQWFTIFKGCISFIVIIQYCKRVFGAKSLRAAVIMKSCFRSYIVLLIYIWDQNAEWLWFPKNLFADWTFTNWSLLEIYLM